MKRIRIGNDVIVRTSLGEFETDDKLKIKTLQCLFIKQKHNDKSDNDMCYEPSQYVYGCCGCCNYNAAVYNNGYNMPCTLRDPHWFPGYNGFGVNSNKFNCPKEYQSDIRVFDNYVESYFPAKDQKLGIFKVVFVAQVYTTGWGMNDLKTITIDKGELFTLVDSAEQSTTDGLIDLTDSQGSDQENDKLIVDAIFIKGGKKDKVQNQFILGVGDTHELLDCVTSGRYVIEYLKNSVYNYITKENAKHFNFNIIQNNKPALSTVDEFGTITCRKEMSQFGGNSYDDVSIVVTSKYDNNIKDYVEYSVSSWNTIAEKYIVPSIDFAVTPITMNYKDKIVLSSHENIRVKLNEVTTQGFNIPIIYTILVSMNDYSADTERKDNKIWLADKYYVNKYLKFSIDNTKNVADVDTNGDIIITGRGSTRMYITNKAGQIVAFNNITVY